MNSQTGGMRLEILQDFKWAHRGVEVVEYTKGDTIETDDQDLIEVSTSDANKWAAKAKKAKPGAPENKDAAGKNEENKDAEA
jgi:hypothetical protein